MRKGYFLVGSRGEYMMVIRTDSVEPMQTIIDRLARIRDKEIKEIVHELEFDLERMNREQNR